MWLWRLNAVLLLHAAAQFMLRLSLYSAAQAGETPER